MLGLAIEGLEVNSVVSTQGKIHYLMLLVLIILVLMT